MSGKPELARLFDVVVVVLARAREELAHLQRHFLDRPRDRFEYFPSLTSNRRSDRFSRSLSTTVPALAGSSRKLWCVRPRFSIRPSSAKHVTSFTTYSRSRLMYRSMTVELVVTVSPTSRWLEQLPLLTRVQVPVDAREVPAERFGRPPSAADSAGATAFPNGRFARDTTG